MTPEDLYKPNSKRKGRKQPNRRKPEDITRLECRSSIMMDKYIQLDLNLPSRRIYGLGERNTNFALGEGSWTMWASGQDTTFDDGSTGSA